MMSTYIHRTPNHVYSFDGVTYPGVTSVLDILDKSGPLMAWAARMTAEAAVGMAGSLSALVETVGPQGAVKALTARSAWKNEDAKMLGTEVHHLADLLQAGQALPPVSPTALVRIEHYDQWLRSSGWRMRCSEGMLVNPGWGYGGTLDILAYDRDGATVLADIKTGNIAYRGHVYDSIVLQLAAYGNGTWIEDADALYAMPEIDRYAVIHVTAEGCTEVPVDVGKPEREAFHNALRLYRWRESMKGKKL